MIYLAENKERRTRLTGTDLQFFQLGSGNVFTLSATSPAAETNPEESLFQPRIFSDSGSVLVRGPIDR